MIDDKDPSGGPFGLLSSFRVRRNDPGPSETRSCCFSAGRLYFHDQHCTGCWAHSYPKIISARGSVVHIRRDTAHNAMEVIYSASLRESPYGRFRHDDKRVENPLIAHVFRSTPLVRYDLSQLIQPHPPPPYILKETSTVVCTPRHKIRRCAPVTERRMARICAI